ALVAGRNRVPSPAAGNTALRTLRKAFGELGGVPLVICRVWRRGSETWRLTVAAQPELCQCGETCMDYVRRDLLFLGRLLFFGPLGVLGRFFAGGILAGCVFCGSILRVGGCGGCVSFRFTRLACVIRDVPAGTLKLNGRLREEALDLAAAMRALLQVRASNLLNSL